MPGQVWLEDLSPAGVACSGEVAVTTGQVIKLDASQFSAVAEVSYCRQNGAVHRFGARFLTVRFNRNTGGFLSVST